MENKVKKHFIDVELIKALMKEKNIDEKAMAASMGVTVRTVKRFLSGADQRHYRGDILRKLSQALGVPSDTLIIRKDYR